MFSFMWVIITFNIFTALEIKTKNFFESLKQPSFKWKITFKKIEEELYYFTYLEISLISDFIEDSWILMSASDFNPLEAVACG